MGLGPLLFRDELSPEQQENQRVVLFSFLLSNSIEPSTRDAIRGRSYVSWAVAGTTLKDKDVAVRSINASVALITAIGVGANVRNARLYKALAIDGARASCALCARVCGKGKKD